MVYDNGEVDALTSIFEQLDEEKVSYQNFATGPAIDKLKDHPGVVKWEGYEKLQNLSCEEALIPREYDYIMETFSPSVVVTSMASRAQGDLAQGFRKGGAQVIAYYENFDPVETKEFVEPFLKVSIGGVDLYMVPSTRVKESFLRLNASRGETIPVEVMGQPSLEKWAEAHGDKALKERMERKKAALCGFEEDRPLLIFAGGYDPTYEAALKMFVEAVKTSSYNALITPHPKTDGSLEEAIVKELGASGRIKVISPKQQKEGFSTMNLSVMKPDYLVCHKSTVCMQGLAVNIPAVYIADKDYKNFAIETGIAQRVASVDQFRTFLEKKPSAKTIHLEDMGIPSHAVEKMTAHFKRQLVKTTTD